MKISIESSQEIITVKLVKKKMNLIKETNSPLIEARPIASSRPQLDLIQDPQFRRNKSSVDMNTALHLFNTDKYAFHDLV